MNVPLGALLAAQRYIHRAPAAGGDTAEGVTVWVTPPGARACAAARRGPGPRGSPRTARQGPSRPGQAGRRPGRTGRCARLGGTVSSTRCCTTWITASRISARRSPVGLAVPGCSGMILRGVRAGRAAPGSYCAPGPAGQGPVLAGHVGRSCAGAVPRAAGRPRRGGPGRSPRPGRIAGRPASRRPAAPARPRRTPRTGGWPRAARWPARSAAPRARSGRYRCW